MAPVPLDPDDDALLAFRSVLRALDDTIVRTVPLVVEERDPEDLHDLRVALRRTRSVLGDAKGVLGKRRRRANRVLFKWLGEVTGPARDLDVFVEGLAGVPAVDGIRTALEGRRRASHERVNEVLLGEAAVDGLARWTAWLERTHAPADDGPIGPLVVRRVARAQRSVLDAGRAITDDAPAEALHDLRKDAKRLRYALECFGGLFDPDARKAFVDQLKALQDNLGAFQDAEVQLDLLRLVEADIEVDDRPALVDLRDIVRGDAREARAAFAARFAAYDTDANEAAFTALLATVRPSGPAPASARPAGPA